MVSLLMQIPSTAITNKDTQIFTKRLERWQNQYAEQAKKVGIPITRFLRGTVIFSIEGYDADPRELYEIPEVREWFRELRERISSLFYYLDPDPAHHQYSVVIPMYLEFTPVPGEGVQISSDSLRRFVEAETENVRFFAERIGDDPEEAGIMFLNGLERAMS